MIVKRIKIKKGEMGLLFRQGEFVKLLDAGKYWVIRLFLREQVDILNLRAPWINHPQLDAVMDSGALEGKAEVIDLKDNQRALVWVDGRFNCILGPGRYAAWNQVCQIKVELRDARELRFEHPEKEVILKYAGVANFLNVFLIEEGFVGVAFENGKFREILEPGRYATWHNAGKYKVHNLDLREKVLDVTGQEIMTADRVTLRMNAVVTYRIVDPLKAVMEVVDVEQALYRETQLAIRAEVGGRDLEGLLTEKDAVARATAKVLKARAAEFGTELRGLGVRDVILPGDMKELLNKVTEARKAAEANVIKRREETAAMRSQVNTAKLMEQNDVLMRLRELEVLEKVAQYNNLNVVLGNEGLSDRLFKLI